MSTAKQKFSEIGTAVLALMTALLPASTISAETVRLGQVNLSFYAVTGGIVQEVLERSGQAFTVVEGSHGAMYPKLGAGEIDILAASWLPNAHAALYEKVKDSTFLLAKLYEGGQLYLSIPGYAPEGIVSVQDLTKPEFSAKIEKKIVGIDPSSGLMIGAARMMDSYALGAAGYTLVPGPAANWIENFKNGYAEKRVFVMPLWQPQWLNAAFKIRRLADPLKIYGDGDTAYLIAHTALRAKLPAVVVERLGKIKLPIDAVTEMDRMVSVDGKSARDAARKWIASNPEKTADWFP